MELSIVISTHNNVQGLTRTISSIKRTIQSPYEILVVADACTDNTEEVVSHAYPDVKVVSVPDIGWGGANNVGATLARGQYLFFLGSDCELDNNWFPPLKEFYESTPRCGAITPLTTKGEHLHGGGILGWPWGMFGRYASVDPAKPDGVPVDFVWYPFIHKDRFASVGGFDDGYFLYFDDVDLGLRLKKAGFQNFIVTGSRMATEATPPRNIATYYTSRSQFRFILKHNPMFLIPILFPAFVAKEAAKSLVTMLDGRLSDSRELIRATLYSLRHLRDSLLSRHCPGSLPSS
jgi:GT2 family glycosyltransferase